MSDMSRAGIESGPVAAPIGPWEDDEPGDECSLCRGAGWLEDPRGNEHDCPACDGGGVAL